MTPPDPTLARALADVVKPLRGSATDLDPVLDLVGNASVVLLGEATHGTHEFYRIRADLTRRLIAEKGFSAVAAEADWPDAQRVNAFVRGRGGHAPRDAVDALSDFKRFPAWMWRNVDVLDFIRWLRAHNERLRAPERVGFYGLDLYSLHASMASVIAYLDEFDPDAAIRARQRYACFDHAGDEPQAYGYAATLGLRSDCEEEVLSQLLELQRERARSVQRIGVTLEDAQFEAEQNARVVVRAEQYYRTMFTGRISSWNLRDTHMADTLDALFAHLGRRFDRPKVVVWAHNSHVGDARATEMGDRGEVNIGQLVRERRPGEAVLVGFSTYGGTVTAASKWGGPAERRDIVPGLRGSYEELFHQTGVASFLVPLRDVGLGAKEGIAALHERRLQRAIGVVYLPSSERQSHYFMSRVPAQFDALLHIDRTRALEPLERDSQWTGDEPPGTFPSGV